MRISIDIKGLPELNTELEDLVPDLVRKVTLGIEQTGKVLVQTSPATGKLYKRGSGWHQASAPGEPPAWDTGILFKSIQSFFESPEVGVIEVGAFYGSILEAKNRPFMSTAIEKTLDQFF
jgi:hypothetical protein